MSDTKTLEKPTDQAEPDEPTTGDEGTAVVINPDELVEGISGASSDELELVLETLQQANFVEWHRKILAGQFQRRVVFTLETRQAAESD